MQVAVKMALGRRGIVPIPKYFTPGAGSVAVVFEQGVLGGEAFAEL